MSVLHPNPGPHPVHTVHRVSAATMGALLIGFAAVSFARGVMPTSTGGLWVLGLSSNGPLSILSIVVGCLLLGAAYRSGTAASNVSILFGVLFLLSGLINSVLISTSLNLLAFQLTNVVFSFGAGLSMLVLGSYGRISGALPQDNPYRHSPVEISAPRSAPDLGSRPAPTAIASE
jgi:hypothetical protein